MHLQCWFSSRSRSNCKFHVGKCLSIFNGSWHSEIHGLLASANKSFSVSLHAWYLYLYEVPHKSCVSIQLVHRTIPITIYNTAYIYGVCRYCQVKNSLWLLSSLTHTARVSDGRSLISQSFCNQLGPISTIHLQLTLLRSIHGMVCLQDYFYQQWSQHSLGTNL